MRREKLAFNEINSKKTIIAGLADIVSRSTWLWQSVIQVYKVMGDFAFISCPETDARNDLNHSRINNSLPTEEGFGIMGNAPKNANRRTTIQESYRTLRDSCCLSDRHRFTEVELTEPHGIRTDGVSPDADQIGTTTE